MNHPTTTSSVAPRHRRHLRNFLLDRHFQLKYAAFLSGLTLILSASLGALLVTTGQELIAQSRAAVHQGEQVVVEGQRVLNESRKVSTVVRMNIANVPEYANNPELGLAFAKDAAAQDEHLARQQKELQRQAADLRNQSARIEVQQRRMLLSILGGLGVLIVVLGFAGIVVTHRIAGPVFKMRRQLRQIGDGVLTLPLPLRKGDELRDFFLTLEETIRKLRQRQQEEIDVLSRARDEIGTSVPTAVDLLRGLEDAKRSSLGD